MPDLLDSPRMPFVVHCKKCQYEWALCFLPMELSLFAKFGRAARCPMCAGMQVVVGPLIVVPSA